ncbi:hypothetical protein CRE_23231, partial [Caenorhabditis remanei]
MSAKYVVTIASCFSGLAIVACLFTVGAIFKDINDLYDNVMDDMDEFKMFANNAWKDMIPVTRPSLDNQSNLRALFGREKRQAGQCNCG